MNENANLLSIVQYLINAGEDYILNRDIDTLKDPGFLKRSLDVYPSFFFMTDMEYQSNVRADPSLVKADPNDESWFPAESKKVLRDYVSSGGTIVQTGTVYGWDVDFLNNIFDLNLKAVPEGTDPTKQPYEVDSTQTWQRQPVLDELELGERMQDESIQVLKGVDTVDASQITPGVEYTSLYGSVDNSLVGMISYGEGKIYYVGSDYRFSGYNTNWGEGVHVRGEYTETAFVEQVLPAILEQAAKEAKENLPFPQNYENNSGNIVVDDGKPIDENSFEFGPGQDKLINRCSLQATGEGLIDLGPDDDLMETNMFISATTLDGGADDDLLILTDDNACADGESADTALEARAMTIVNFEDVEVQGGTWELQGDYQKTDVLINGGELSVPLTRRRSPGLRAKQFEFSSGGITIDLSDADPLNGDLAGRWSVVKAQGVRNNFNGEPSELIDVVGADRYEIEFLLRKSRLVLQLDA